MKKLLKFGNLMAVFAILLAFAIITGCNPQVGLIEIPETTSESGSGGSSGGSSCGDTPTPAPTPTPATLVSIAVSGSPSFEIENVAFAGTPSSAYGLTVTATYDDNSTRNVSASTVVASDVRNTAGDITFSYAENGVTKTAIVQGSFYIASSDALTPVPVAIEGYSGTLADGIYMKFGDFPQTVVPNNSTLTYSDVAVYNGWKLGSDGYFYENCAEKAFANNYTYTDTTTAKQNSEGSRYFKVEPIKWRVLTTSYDIDGNSGTATGKLLLAENILINCKYYDYYNVNRDINGTVYPNNYKESKIRAYLNGLSYTVKATGEGAQTTDSTFNGKGFLYTAFTTGAQGVIVETYVDNSADSTTDAGNNITKATTYACSNTTDKIFLLSYQEVTTAGYGFDLYNRYVGDSNGTTESSRIRITTDYAKANGANQATTSGRGGLWWLRSPNYRSSSYARTVYNTGYAYGDFSVGDDDSGVVPALCLN